MCSPLLSEGGFWSSSLRHQRCPRRTGRFGSAENGVVTSEVSEDALRRARAGDEDAVQDTLLAAWRGLARFEERATLRAWLYRIATNRCLNVLRDRSRRPKEVPAMAEPPEPTRTIEPVWLEPYPRVLLEGLAETAPRPGGRY